MDSMQDTIIDGLPLPKLVGSNYSRWKLKMTNALEAKGLEEIVFGEDMGPSATELTLVKTEITDTNKASVTDAKAKFQRFKTRDASARMLLTCCMDDKHLDIVEDCHTSREIWNKLGVEYRDKSSKNYHQLLKDFYGIKKSSDQSVSEYVAKVDSIASRLRDLGHPQDETAIVIRIVQGLTDDFEAVTRWWDMTPNEYQTKELLLMNLKKEEQRQQSDKTSGEALMARTSKGNKSYNRNSRRPRNRNFVKKGVCNWCKQPGHWWEECPTRPKDQTPESQKNKDSKNKVKALCAKVSEDDDLAWYFDSGASYHMTGHREWFTDFKNFTEKVPIKFGDRLSLEAIGKGTVRVLSHVGKKVKPIDLENVWYIPNISNNLFSWGAASQKGVRLVSEENTMALMDDNEVLVTGKLTGVNLWKLNITVEVSAKICSSGRTLEDWHKAMGHPDIAQIKNMVNNKCVTGLEIVKENQLERCGDCQLGKGHHLSHPSSRRERATEVLERVHVDLAGPIEPASLSGSKYFMLIKDEFSGYMFVYFMATKSHVYQKIEQFVKEASITTQKRVKIIRSDNGLEFKNQGMTVLCAKEGIIQEFSAPYTPEQNGLIERANRTIGETARTMLQASELSLSLWAEAVNTAVYLRNRMTNSVNKEKTPFELFLGHKPDLSHIVPFGQEVHVIDHSTRASKFSPKTIEAYVVGYGERVNTYRCLISGTKDILITSDVVPASHKQRTRETRTDSRPLVTFLECRSFPDSNEIRTETDQNSASAPSGGTGIDLPEQSNEISRDNCTMPPLIGDQIRVDAPRSQSEATNSSRNQTNVEQQSRDVSQSRAQPTSYSRVVSSGANTSSIASASAVATTGASVPQSDYVSPILPHRVSSQAAETAPQSRIPIVYPNLSTVRFADRPQIIPQVGSTAQVTQQQRGAQEQRGTVAPNVQGTNLVNRIRNAVTNLSPKKRVVPPRNVKSTYARNLVACATSDAFDVDKDDAVIPLEPKTYLEAVSGDDGNQWQLAIDDELNAHAKNCTWEIVPKDDSVKEISSKWVFKYKHGTNGEKGRYKARLVARGFVQVAGIDYGEIFSPVVRMDSLRLLFSLCAQYNLEYEQFDITTAFLNGEIEEELYLCPPEGLKIEKDQTCKLKRSLYGLKQAPRCWNNKFVDMLKMFNMRQTQSDPCVFVGDGGEILYLALYVDDGLIFAQRKDTIERLISYLKKHFEVKLVNSACFLGLEIVQNRRESSIFLHQNGYIKRVLERFKMNEAKGVATPLETGHSLSKKETLNEKPIEGVPYAEAIGSLLYCAMATRPDIAYTLSVLSKYTKEPRSLHWTGVKRVMRYLKATMNHGLIYKPVNDPKIICFSDADYAGDQATRKSTSGIISFINTGPISFKAKQQECVALSTTEAEYMACAIGVKDLIWLRRFTEELGAPINQEAWLLCDNQGAIRLVKNPEFHERTKHIDIKFHFIREKYADGIFELRYVETDQQRADIFTKSLSADKHNYLRNEIGCVSLDCNESRRVLK